MKKNDFKVLCLIDMTARSAKRINSQNIFSFNSPDEVKSLQEEAKKNNIEYDDALRADEFSIELKDKGVYLYENFEHFNQSFAEIVKASTNYRYHCYYDKILKQLMLLHIENDTIQSYIFDSNDQNNKTAIYSLSNIYYWNLIFHLIRSIAESVEPNKTLHIRSISKGERIIEYNHYDIKFNDIDLKEKYLKLKKVIEEISAYSMIFKNRLVERIQNNESTYSITDFILELETICNKAETDYAIATYKIDFESYLIKYNTEINQFLDKARRITEKLLTNIFTLPLSYATAVFTFDKLKQPQQNRAIIFAAMLVYTLLSIFFVIYELFEARELRRKFNESINLFTNGSDKLKENIKIDLKNIKYRLNAIKVLNVFLIFTFIGFIIWLSNIFFGIF